MKKIYMIIILFLIGCGGNKEDDTNIYQPINDKYYYEQWYINVDKDFYTQNDIDENASINSADLLHHYTGKGIKVAVIDDGLDVYHEDLKEAIVSTYDQNTNSTNVLPSNDQKHGTAVTGIIGARSNNIGIKGVASDAEIIFIKYKEYSTDSETIELFDKAVELGADVINCSWGTYDVSEAVKDKIVDLANNARGGRGMAIVFACGNDNEDMENDESNIKEVISVGATNRYNNRASYSNYGKNLDILAPGGEYIGITTTDIRADDGYVNGDYDFYDSSNPFAGTSASAPIVTGIIALMLEKNPNLTRVEIENILKESADKIGNMEYIDGRNDYYGYGKVNLYKAMQMIK